MPASTTCASTTFGISFASSAVGFGQSLPMIGKLLGHTQAQTTACYAHLAADPMQAAEQVISNIASILYGRPLQSQDADAELA